MAGAGSPLTGFFIDSFSVPPFLLPIYQAAAEQYDVPWPVLAAINEVESDYGHDLSVSTAGAEGWMQFLPSTWSEYGVDAVGAGWRDPYNPADAIFAAARYLAAAGAAQDLPGAIYAYNHSAAYVKSVLLRASLLDYVPGSLLDALTTMLDGHFPVERQAHPHVVPEPAVRTRVLSPKSPRATSVGSAKLAPAPTQTAPASTTVKITTTVPGVKIIAPDGTPVIAIKDAEVLRIGYAHRLGRFVQLRDAAGNVYTYGRLGSIATRYPVPKSPRALRALDSATAPAVPPRPFGPASAGYQRASKTVSSAPTTPGAPSTGYFRVTGFASSLMGAGGQLLSGDASAGAKASSSKAADDSHSTGRSTLGTYVTPTLGIIPQELRLAPLREGSRVLAGTILGRIGGGDHGDPPQILFEIRPAGDGRIDPRPILENWLALDAVQRQRKFGAQPLFGPNALGTPRHVPHARQPKRQPQPLLGAGQWTQLMQRLAKLPAARVPSRRSSVAVPDHTHGGE